MWPAIVAIVSAIIGFIQFAIIFWYITTHFQQLQDAIKQAFTYPGIAVGSTVEPLVIGGIAFFGALAGIAYLYWRGVHHVEPKTPAPTFAPISAATYPSAAAVQAARFAPYPYAVAAAGPIAVGAGPQGGGVVRPSRPAGGGRRR